MPAIICDGRETRQGALMMMMGQCFFFSAAVQVDGGLVLTLTGVGGVRRGYSYLYSCQCENEEDSVGG